MTQDQPLLRLRGLTARYFTEEGPVDALAELELTIDRGEVYGLVGQSGSGKTTAALSVMDLLEPPGQVTDGEVWFRAPELAERYNSEHPEATDGDLVELRRLPSRARRRINRGSMRLIPEDADQALNPTLTVEAHLDEALRVERPAGAQPPWLASEPPSFADRLRSLLPIQSALERRRREQAHELLDRLGFPDPADGLETHPHELSEGMARRVVIAQAIATGPELLIADEPVARLAGTEQAQILRFLDTFRSDTGMSILFLSKDPQVINSLCDRVGVLYAGELVAEGTPEEVFEKPAHPSLHRLE